MINTNCWRQPIPVSVFDLPVVARLIYQELLMNAARNDNGGTLTINKHHYKLERGQCFFSDLSLARILNRDPKTVEKWRKYLEKMGNRMGNRVGNSFTPLIRSSSTRDGRIYTLLDYDKITGMGNSSESTMGTTVGNRVGTDIRLQNTDTSTYARAYDGEKIIQTQNLITEQNGEKKIQPILLAQEPFLPKVPEKGITASVRSDALVALVQISKEFGLSIRWESNEDEIKQAVDLLGLDQVLQAMRDYSEYCAKQGFTQVLWNKFKANRLSKSSPKEQIERVKKTPEYQQDRVRQLDKRSTVSYTSMPKMSKLSDVYATHTPVELAPERKAFIDRSKRLESIIQRSGITVNLGMVGIDQSFYDDYSDEDIVHVANKILDKQEANASLTKEMLKKERRVGATELKQYLAGLQRERATSSTS